MKVFCAAMLFFVTLSLPDKCREPKAAVLLNGPMIQIVPDSLFFETEESYDTLLVVNHGDVDLVIDSVKASSGLGYDIEVITKDMIFNWSIFLNLDIEQFERNQLVLAPGDSAQLIMFSPDLCPICSSSSFFDFFTDTLFVFSNDPAHNPVKIFTSGQGRPSAVEEKTPDVPHDFFLHENYPNPFNPTTSVDFSTPVSTEVKIVVYNSLGQEVKTLVHGRVEVGDHHILWNGRDHNNVKVSSGVYFLRMIVPQGPRKTQYAKTIKMTFLE